MTEMNIFTLLMICSSLTACGGGSGSADNQLTDDPARTDDPAVIDDPAFTTPPVTIDDPIGPPPIELTPGVVAPNPETSDKPDAGLPTADQSRYRVTLENLWGAEDFPQGFPEDGHLSLVGGATHNMAVSFWDVGDIASRGIEDMAEAGLIDKLLFDEVGPAIVNGTADSMIEIREYTDAKIDGVSGKLEFTIDMNFNWPLVSMVTMLGPSPDWFVGVSGLPLVGDDGWLNELVVDLPLHDAGTKSDITPIMGGPDIIPADPVGLVAYDAATGVYLPSEEPQIVARITFERIEL